MNRRLFILGILLGVASAAWSQVPATFFGMTINHAPIEETMWPEVPIGAIRLWDTGTSWRAMNPAPGVYEWSKLDQWFRIAKRHDVDILYTFGRTPDWASSNLQAECSYGKGQCAPPKDLRAWDDFVRALATHAAGRIKYWEIWNEANQPESWTGSLPQLVDMARRAKAIIQAIDPKAVLLTPSATGKEGPGWLSAYLDAKGGHSADVIAFHGYCGADPENIAVLLEKYRKIAAARGLEKSRSGTPKRAGESQTSCRTRMSARPILPSLIFSIYQTVSNGSTGTRGTTTSGERSPAVPKSSQQAKPCDKSPILCRVRRWTSHAPRARRAFGPAASPAGAKERSLRHGAHGREPLPFLVALRGCQISRVSKAR